MTKKVGHSIEDFSHYHFRGQRDDEIILSVIHRHWFDIVMHYVLITFVALTMLAGTLFVGLFESSLGVEHIMPLILLVDSFLVVFLWFYGFITWIDYWLDVWIVTNRRVVNIEQKGLFSRQVSELYFHTIQDITSNVRGIIPTLLNYGDVEVQTAAEHTRFLFRSVPDPYAVKAMLVEMQRKTYNESEENLPDDNRNDRNEGKEDGVA